MVLCYTAYAHPINEENTLDSPHHDINTHSAGNNFLNTPTVADQNDDGLLPLGLTKHLAREAHKHKTHRNDKVEPLADQINIDGSADNIGVLDIATVTRASYMIAYLGAEIGRGKVNSIRPLSFREDCAEDHECVAVWKGIPPSVSKQIMHESQMPCPKSDCDAKAIIQNWSQIFVRAARESYIRALLLSYNFQNDEGHGILVSDDDLDFIHFLDKWLNDADADVNQEKLESFRKVWTMTRRGWFEPDAQEKQTLVTSRGCLWLEHLFNQDACSGDSYMCPADPSQAVHVISVVSILRALAEPGILGEHNPLGIALLQQKLHRPEDAYMKQTPKAMYSLGRNSSAFRHGSGRNSSLSEHMNGWNSSAYQESLPTITNTHLKDGVRRKGNQSVNSYHYGQQKNVKAVKSDHVKWKKQPKPPISLDDMDEVHRKNGKAAKTDHGDRKKGREAIEQSIRRAELNARSGRKLFRTQRYTTEVFDKRTGRIWHPNLKIDTSRTLPPGIQSLGYVALIAVDETGFPLWESTQTRLVADLTPITSGRWGLIMLEPEAMVAGPAVEHSKRSLNQEFVAPASQKWHLPFEHGSVKSTERLQRRADDGGEEEEEDEDLILGVRAFQALLTDHGGAVTNSLGLPIIRTVDVLDGELDTNPVIYSVDAAVSQGGRQDSRMAIRTNGARGNPIHSAEPVEFVLSAESAAGNIFTRGHSHLRFPGEVVDQSKIERRGGVDIFDWLGNRKGDSNASPHEPPSTGDGPSLLDATSDDPGSLHDSDDAITVIHELFDDEGPTDDRPKDNHASPKERPQSNDSPSIGDASSLSDAPSDEMTVIHHLFDDEGPTDDRPKENHASPKERPQSNDSPSIGDASSFLDAPSDDRGSFHDTDGGGQPFGEVADSGYYDLNSLGSEPYLYSGDLDSADTLKSGRPNKKYYPVSEGSASSWWEIHANPRWKPAEIKPNGPVMHPKPQPGKGMPDVPKNSGLLKRPITIEEVPRKWAPGQVDDIIRQWYVDQAPDIARRLKAWPEKVAKSRQAYRDSGPNARDWAIDAGVTANEQGYAWCQEENRRAQKAVELVNDHTVSWQGLLDLELEETLHQQRLAGAAARRAEMVSKVHETGFELMKYWSSHPLEPHAHMLNIKRLQKAMITGKVDVRQAMEMEAFRQKGSPHQFASYLEKKQSEFLNPSKSQAVVESVLGKRAAGVYRRIPWGVLGKFALVADVVDAATQLATKYSPDHSCPRPAWREEMWNEEAAAMTTIRSPCTAKGSRSGSNAAPTAAPEPIIWTLPDAPPDIDHVQFSGNSSDEDTSPLQARTAGTDNNATMTPLEPTRTSLDLPSCPSADMGEDYTWAYVGGLPCPVPTPVECGRDWFHEHINDLPAGIRSPRHCVVGDLTGHERAKAMSCWPDFQGTACKREFGLGDVESDRLREEMEDRQEDDARRLNEGEGESK
jgi:hypothetical protein